MRLLDLSLLQFKNYEEAALTFSPHANCLVGVNGSGKTNLLDAIHYLSMTRSAFTAQDQMNIKTGEDFFLLKGTFEKSAQSWEPKPELNSPEQISESGNTDSGTTDDISMLAEPPTAKRLLHKITCTVKAGQRKVLTHNKLAYEKASEHIGRYPVVFSSPYDTDLIREGSEERRKFFDSLLSQLDPNYLQDLIFYTHLLKQRNSLLRQFSDRNYLDRDLLQIMTEPMIEPAQRLTAKRVAFLERFVPVFQRHYAFLAQDREMVMLEHKSQLPGANFEELLKNAERKDLALQRTTTGPHRDDFVFGLNNLPIKNFGSQGQQKSYVIALKLAQFEVLAQEKGFKPLLLLDDIFDRLDEQRIAHLLEMVAAHTFGQLFITDSHLGRTARLLSKVTDELKCFEVASGHVKTI
jgi:DNA replication and repair protein RecF